MNMQNTSQKSLDEEESFEWFVCQQVGACYSQRVCRSCPRDQNKQGEQARISKKPSLSTKSRMIHCSYERYQHDETIGG